MKWPYCKCKRRWTPVPGVHKRWCVSCLVQDLAVIYICVRVCVCASLSVTFDLNSNFKQVKGEAVHSLFCRIVLDLFLLAFWTVCTKGPCSTLRIRQRGPTFHRVSGPLSGAFKGLESSACCHNHDDSDQSYSVLGPHHHMQGRQCMWNPSALHCSSLGTRRVGGGWERIA